MTKSELDKIIEYINIKGFLPDNFANYSRLYSMTTENIYGFLNKYDLKDKKILTVAGSGDQRLNAYLLGASEVTCFDVNSLCDFQLKLKDTAIKSLDYDSYLDFFGLTKNKFFDSLIFDELKNYLDDETYYFYDFLINRFYRGPKKGVYYDFDNNVNIQRNFNNYLDLDGYNKLSAILDTKNVNFINSSIDNLPEILGDEKFDMILLSNISDYIHQVYQDDYLERFKEIINRLTDNLNLYGTIQVGYIYSRYKRGEDVSNFHFNAIRNKVFPNFIFHSCFVDSYYNDGTYDKIITYQKLK